MDMDAVIENPAGSLNKRETDTAAALHQMGANQQPVARNIIPDD